ncbi:extracellular solute-binding protein [Paenibacillus agricola]|uniref:Extracellular solute-binding protein n=1 Tax=Paenibacillus agricola TaxID=2716264 RepID=A0ABX0J6S0_9BACL|nr:extracellular solute-binding protein [Paenibacillus agricola]NHN31476.1 extracellular solute-binding protein [Paenibacillus agricola]
MNNKKWSSSLGGATVLTLLLSACSSGGSAPANSTAAVDTGPLELKFIAPLYSEPLDMNNKLWTEFQKATNTKLNVEWIPSGDYATKINLVYSSGNIPEILIDTNATNPTLINAIRGGAFWDLTALLGDLSQYPNFKNNLHPDAFKYVTVDKKIFGLPRSRPNLGNGIKIRKDWLDKLNIPVPTTLDEYTAAIKKIADSDPDGNGKKDTIGILSVGIPGAHYQPAFGVNKPFYNAEGGLVDYRLTPQYTSYLEWLRKQYADGLMAKEFTAIKDTQAIELFTTGQAVSYVRDIWWDFDWEKALNKLQPGAKLLNLSPLKGPNGTTVDLTTGNGGGIYISKKVPEEKVKRILEYFNKTASKELTDMVYYGVEGVHFTTVNGQSQITELGSKEVTASTIGLSVLSYKDSKWGKIVSRSAPKEYNDAKINETKDYEKSGTMNPFSVIISNKWVEVWPTYESEWKTMSNRMIVGQISVEEYKQYVEKITNLPDLKQAFKEFAQAYKDFFQK